MDLCKEPRQNICAVKRNRILEAYHNGENYIEIAKQLDVKRKTAHTIVYRNKHNINYLEKKIVNKTDNKSCEAQNLQTEISKDTFIRPVAFGHLVKIQKENKDKLLSSTNRPVDVEENLINYLIHSINDLKEKIEMYGVTSQTHQHQEQQQDFNIDINPTSKNKKSYRHQGLNKLIKFPKEAPKPSMLVNKEVHETKGVENENYLEKKQQTVGKPKKRKVKSILHALKLKTQKKNRAKKIRRQQKRCTDSKSTS